MNAQPTDLDAIRERLALIDGYTTPWEVAPDDDNHTWVIGYTTTNPLAGLVATVPDYGEHLADLIAHAPTDLKALLAMVDHLRQKHAEVQETSMRRGEEISRLHGELQAARTRLAAYEQSYRDQSRMVAPGHYGDDD